MSAVDYRKERKGLSGYLPHHLYAVVEIVASSLCVCNVIDAINRNVNQQIQDSKYLDYIFQLYIKVLNG